MKLTITVKALPFSEHDDVTPTDMVRAAEAIKPLVKLGALSGKTRFDVPHSHMGDSCNALYEADWMITASE